MNNIENNLAGVQETGCQGADCAALNIGKDWFGDLEISAEDDGLGADTYGDRV